MKKLYQGKGRRVHPAPPPAPDAALALLPAALLALAATLAPEEQEVLAYLLSGIGTGGGGAPSGRRSTKRHNGPHQPEMGCGCFGCYKTYWARWDASPNRHLIHRIIDAVEEGSSAAASPAGPTRRRRRRGGRAGHALDSAAAADAPLPDACRVDLQPCCASDGGADDDGDYEGDDDDGADSVYGGGDGDDALTDDSDCSASASAEKSAVGKLVRFIGEKVWAAWT
ncbi:uncharacterized protein LOC124679036 [Lolium rigidum]|uniref:uncharacterized protein LOC124679036 n=1 Tax=Lolium rigidum TaxID=89674 RepID=UPI001F5CED49|nr:uncharacterized protein LOC124679036 [Lolium rigidum]